MVANQLERLGGYEWAGAAEEVGDDGCDGLAHPGATRRRADGPAAAGFHRYHSADLVTDLSCAQVPDGMLAGLDGSQWPPGAQLHVALDDDGRAARRADGPARSNRKASTQVVEGSYEATQRVGGPDVAGPGHRVLAGAPRRRAASTARWSRTGPSSSRA